MKIEVLLIGTAIYVADLPQGTPVPTVGEAIFLKPTVGTSAEQTYGRQYRVKKVIHWWEDPLNLKCTVHVVPGTTF